MRIGYGVGRASALAAVGLKTAETDSGATAQMAGMGAAAVAPFAGLVGQQKIIHDPLMGAKAPSVGSMVDLQRLARPGDVVVTTKPSGSVWKNFIAPLSGSEFYHAQPIVGQRGGHGTTSSAGEFAQEGYDTLNKAEVLAEADTLNKSMKGQYSDAVLLRPKNLSKAQAKAVAGNSALRSRKPYDSVTGTLAWLNDVFMPKVKGIERLGRQVVCKGNVCSTMPAQAFTEETGRSVVPGVAAKRTMPPDFLRSTEYELIGSRVDPEKYRKSKLLRKAMPYLSRGALGLGLAGGVYAATEDPALVAGAAGGATGLAGGWEAARRKGYKGFVDPLEAAAALFDRKAVDGTKSLKGFSKRNLPLILGGATAAYAGAKGLQHLLSKQEPGSGS